jgi:predicted enzyme related to lactoylglutathione lyase
MPNSNINSVIAVVPVKDQETAVEWYKKLFGRVADIIPVEGVAEWELAENAWIQVTADPGQAGSTTVVIGVNDIDTQCIALADADVPHGEVVEYPEIIKMVEVLDPDGNKVAFVQDISKGI